jgi:GalNAc-alpha-(1->4)-GalNAc-alpha-(1->3)-diNAcBac-PP-undecaprenol alpha-1,4-N-acetyl-D-galactosaminyltransferase
LRIIFLVSSLGAGGAERVASSLCNQWASRGDSVMLVQTYLDASTPFYSLHSSVQLLSLSSLVSRIPTRFGMYIARLHALRQLIALHSPDVVISFLPNVNIVAVFATFFKETKLIICERSDPAIQPIGWILRSACIFLYRYADIVCVQTETVSKSIHQVFPGLKSVTAIPNPLPAGLLQRESHSTTCGRRTLLSLGRISDEKQVHLIVSAFGLLAVKHCDWDLHVYGDGPLRSALQSQVNSMGLAERVHLKGNTTKPLNVMAQADAFVMASRYEGFPNALLEAMGVGLPCVAVDCPSGPREISRDGKDALLVDVGDKTSLVNSIDLLMADATFRKELGQRARSSVIERYSLETVLKKWDALFVSMGAKV